MNRFSVAGGEPFGVNGPAGGPACRRLGFR